MNKELEALDYINEWYINNYSDYADIYFEESLNIIKQALTPPNLDTLRDEIIEGCKKEYPHLNWRYDEHVLGFVATNSRGHLVHNVTSYKTSNKIVRLSIMSCDIELANKFVTYFMLLKESEDSE